MTPPQRPTPATPLHKPPISLRLGFTGALVAGCWSVVRPGDDLDQREVGGSGDAVVHGSSGCESAGHVRRSRRIAASTTASKPEKPIQHRKMHGSGFMTPGLCIQSVRICEASLRTASKSFSTSPFGGVLTSLSVRNARLLSFNCCNVSLEMAGRLNCSLFCRDATTNFQKAVLRILGSAR